MFLSNNTKSALKHVLESKVTNSITPIIGETVGEIFNFPIFFKVPSFYGNDKR